MANQARQVRYRFTPRQVAGWAITLLRGQRRSLFADSRLFLGAVGAQPRVDGAWHLPTQGPIVLAPNHYQRPGLWVGWSASAVVQATVGQRPDLRNGLHMLITAEWPLRLFGRAYSNPLLRLLFRRLTAMYGLVALPAMAGQVAGRAGALRAAAALVTRQGPHHALLFFPEGRSGDGLLEALPGSGDFLALLSRLGVPIIPCAVCEDAGQLVVRFGPPLALVTRGPADRAGRDTAARDAVMLAIGRLLPPTLWGAYTGTLTADQARSDPSTLGTPEEST